MAASVTARHYGDAAGVTEREEFERVFRKKELPDNMPDFVVAGPLPLASLVRDAFGLSGGEARRLIEQGAVSIDGEKRTDPRAEVSVTGGEVLRAGKRRFATLVTQ